MRIGDWVQDGLGEQYRIEYFHPYKDHVLLLGTSGWMRWMPYYHIQYWKEIK